ncbi:MBL fold metallo-hydrolase [Streptomyces sodiiphilus]|uniref:MBL fold metallo-hydrolase n=1 Tax=Streptomyces sodiiphilus TaxID=226217 RepID=A0ABN2P2E2_9ACTN
MTGPTSQTHSGAGSPFSRASSLRTLTCGDLRLTYLPDGYVQLHPLSWFPESSPDYWQDKRDHLDAEGFLIGSVGGLLVEQDGRALLIDTGFGPHRIPAEHTIPPLGRLEGGSLPDSLSAAGRTFSSIDTIAFTHLHDDHVGWAFGAGGADAGPVHARYVASEKEWQGWNMPRSAASRLRGRIETAGDGDEIFPGVTVMATPGHTAGHLSYLIGSGSSRVLVIGDVMHSPLQVARPQWRAASDADPAEAVRSRRRVLRELRRPGTAGFGGHFADVVFGNVTEDSAGPHWQPLR